MTMLEVQDLTVRYGGKIVVDQVSFSLEDGQWLMLIGPNGAGKSTIVEALSRGVDYTGTVLCQGKDLRSYRPAALAREIGVLSQTHSVSYGFSVGELVRLGRYASAPGFLSRQREPDFGPAEEALRLTGMDALVHQSILTLSGGELQRAFLAQLFAQNPRILILDEPTNHLDLVYQKQIFELVAAWIRKTGGAVISVVHDLSLARAWGTHALLLDRGRMLCRGTAAEVFRPQLLDQAYQMDVRSWMLDLLRQWEA